MLDPGPAQDGDLEHMDCAWRRMSGERAVGPLAPSRKPVKEIRVELIEKHSGLMHRQNFGKNEEVLGAPLSSSFSFQLSQHSSFRAKANASTLDPDKPLSDQSLFVTGIFESRRSHCNDVIHENVAELHRN